MLGPAAMNVTKHFFWNETNPLFEQKIFRQERQEGDGRQKGNICGISISLRPHCLRHKFTLEKVCVCVCVCGWGCVSVCFLLLSRLIHKNVQKNVSDAWHTQNTNAHSLSLSLIFISLTLSLLRLYRPYSTSPYNSIQKVLHAFKGQ